MAAVRIAAPGAGPQKHCSSPPCAVVLQALPVPRWPREYPAVSLCCIHPACTWHNKEKQWPNWKSNVGTPLGTGLGFPSCSGREWQLDSERRAAADLRSKVYRTIEKLHNSKRTRKPDSAASRTRGEKQLENFLAVFQWNPFAGIAHGNFRHLAAPAQDQPQLPAARHGFRGIQHQIQHRLLEQRAIHVYFRHIDREQLRKMDTGFLKLRSRDFQDFLQKFRELRRFQADIHRPGEIEEALHDRV